MKTIEATYTRKQGWSLHGALGVMQVEEEQHGVREAVGVFHKVHDLQPAIDELLSSGFDRAEISILGSQNAVEAKLGIAQFRRIELGDNPLTPRGLYVSNESMEVGKGSLIGGLALLGGLASAAVLGAAGGPILVAVLGVALATGAAGCSARACLGCLGTNGPRTSKSNWIVAVSCSGFAQGTPRENTKPSKSSPDAREATFTCTEFPMRIQGANTQTNDVAAAPRPERAQRERKTMATRTSDAEWRGAVPGGEGRSNLAAGPLREGRAQQ